MSKTTYEDNGHGTCIHCGYDRKNHYGPTFGSEGDVCNTSMVYVWRPVCPSDLPIAQAALECLRTFSLGKDYDLRILDRNATGDDDWSTSFWWDRSYGNDTKTQYVMVMTGGFQRYSNTLKEMGEAWEFFRNGWRAHASLPVPAPAKKPHAKRVLK